jgi:L-erythro-3,5-diaminohexanoate dehydrogenase
MGALIDATSPPLVHALSTWRARDPPGTLPHLARVLDADADATEWEAEIAVELLAVDATSFQAIRRQGDADPDNMARIISEIVAERGKLQNPWTGSGGVLLGTVQKVGRAHHDPDLRPGLRVMPLASLIAVPLRLDSAGPVNPGSPHVPVRGRAIVTGSMTCVRVPDDLPTGVAITAFDVYPVASYVSEMATRGDHVLVLGAGHAGLLASAAARETVGADGLVTVLDRSAAALARVRGVDPDAALIEADVTSPVAAASAVFDEGLRPADLTLLCTTAPGAEGTAMVTTADRGAILFFSTATSFAAAALGADAAGSHARLVIPNGLTEDRGDYAFELVRRHPPLLDLLGSAA